MVLLINAKLEGVSCHDSEKYKISMENADRCIYRADMHTGAEKENMFIFNCIEDMFK